MERKGRKGTKEGMKEGKGKGREVMGGKQAGEVETNEGIYEEGNAGRNEAREEGRNERMREATKDEVTTQCMN